MPDKNRKLGVVALAALVVSAMIGGGIFSLPQNMAQNASAGAVLCAWIITGIGMFFLANTFRILSEVCPDDAAGIYAYARHGFGRFAGFQMAWSYWLSNIFGNVGYAVLLMDAFDYFFPGVFKGGNNFWSILGGSCVIWVMNFAVLRGIRQAAVFNVIGTVCKLLPILLFIAIMLFAFRLNVFTMDFWGKESIAALQIKPLGSIPEQIRSTMLVTLWAFIGIEGAVVVSGKARSQRDVGRATLTGFLGCLLIYALLSLLPFGRMPQHELAMLPNPSSAPLLQGVVHGSWGGDLMNIGVIIAIFTSWLAFTIMIAQIPCAAAVDGTFPQIFRHENANGTPGVSLIISSCIMQLAMILVGFAGNAWNTMLSITSVMILPPYLACTLFLWKLCAKGSYPLLSSVHPGTAFFCGVAGSCYALWMIYAAGLQYLLMTFCFLLPGIPVFVWARKESVATDPQQPDRRIFTGAELIGAAVIVLAALAAVILMAAGKIKL